LIFDGMDWQTTQAAATFNAQKLAYTEGRGTGLAFLDYGGTKTDYGYCVTSPLRGDAKIDVDAQLVLDENSTATGGYDWRLGGSTPWAKAASRDYFWGSTGTCLTR
jgi:alkaline phosphatase